MLSSYVSEVVKEELILQPKSKSYTEIPQDSHVNSIIKQQTLDRIAEIIRNARLDDSDEEISAPNNDEMVLMDSKLETESDFILANRCLSDVRESELSMEQMFCNKFGNPISSLMN